MAGHSKWANIRHRKGAQDAKEEKSLLRLQKKSQLLLKWVVLIQMVTLV